MWKTYLLAMLLLPCAQYARSENDDGNPSEIQRKKWHTLYQEQAQLVEVERGSDSQQQLKFVPEPVLHWSNPIRPGETNGSVFVWTSEGQVELVGTVFSYLVPGNETQRVIVHSFHSLSLQPLQGGFDGKPAWSFPVAGIDPKPIPAGPSPSRTGTTRLIQMRQLAREFAAAVNLAGESQELRLLPQPLYRNQASSVDVLDGALFAFVLGTDPELMLLIEARQSGDDLLWHYSTARFSDLTITLRHQGVELWTENQNARRQDPNYPYLSQRASIRPALID